MATATVSGADQRIATLHRGAAEVETLLRQIKEKGDADLGAYWAAHPERDGEDGRDYRGLADIVATAIEGNLRHPDAAHREGFLRALTVVLSIEADGCSPSFDEWHPIADTARSFDSESPLLLPAVMATCEPTSESQTINIPMERRSIGLEAVWELEALISMIPGLCENLGRGEDDQAELMRLRLQIRGLAARIGELNGAVMSIFDEDGDTGALARSVFGRHEGATNA